MSIAFAGAGAGVDRLAALAANHHHPRRLARLLFCNGLLVLGVIGPADPAGAPPAGRHGPAAGRRCAWLPRPQARRKASNIVDAAWAANRMDPRTAPIRTGRFWWLVLAYFCLVYAWYAVQVHTDQYLIELGFTPLVAAWSLGLGERRCHPRADRPGARCPTASGREWVWDHRLSRFPDLLTPR